MPSPFTENPLSSEERYLRLFKEGCELSRGLLHIDGQPLKSPGFFEKRKLHKAKRLFESSALEQPANAAPCLMIAKVAYSLGETSNCLQWLLKAWELEPANLILVIELSSAYGALGKHREAVSVLQEGIKYHPDEPRILFNLGLSYLLDRNPELAVAMFQKAVAIEPEFSQNHRLLQYSQSVFEGTKLMPRDPSEISRNI